MSQGRCGARAAPSDAAMLVRGELDDLLALEEGLTDWEVRFVESVNRRMTDGPGPLTDRQCDTLHRIWDRLCGGGR